MAKRKSYKIIGLTDNAYGKNLQFKARRDHMWRQLEPQREALRHTAAKFAPYDYGGFIGLIYTALDYMENYHRLSDLTTSNMRIMEEIRRAKAMAAIVRTNSMVLDDKTNEFKGYKVNAHNVGRFLSHYTEEYVQSNIQAQWELRTAKAAHILFTMLEYNYRHWWD